MTMTMLGPVWAGVLPALFAVHRAGSLAAWRVTGREEFVHGERAAVEPALVP